jgi:tetratricopeptide (TPR) repeat protein
MPVRGRWPLISGVLTASAALVGCTTDHGTDNSPGAFAWHVHAGAPEDRDDLKNPTRLDLTYAQWQEQIGNLPAAEESYRRVLEERPDSVDAMIGLARLEQLAGRPESAERAYALAARSAPGNAQVLDALGQFYASEGRWQEAVKTHSLATQAAPANAVYRQHYAIALARSGKTGESLAHFKQAVGEAEGHYNLGYILYEQGRTELAEREFLQAVTLRPDLAAAQTMLDELRRGGGVPATVARAAPPMRPRPRVMQTAASQPGVEPQNVTPAGGLASPAVSLPQAPPPQWEMPSRGGMSAIQAEQMRNQVVAPARP